MKWEELGVQQARGCWPPVVLVKEEATAEPGQMPPSVALACPVILL